LLTSFAHCNQNNSHVVRSKVYVVCLFAVLSRQYVVNGLAVLSHVIVHLCICWLITARQWCAACCRLDATLLRWRGALERTWRSANRVYWFAVYSAGPSAFRLSLGSAKMWDTTEDCFGELCTYTIKLMYDIQLYCSYMFRQESLANTNVSHASVHVWRLLAKKYTAVNTKQRLMLKITFSGLQCSHW